MAIVKKQSLNKVKEINLKKAESKRGRKSNTEAARIKYYNLPIPEDVFDGIEEYIFKKRKEKKVTIRGFIIDCIKKELENENIL